MTPRIGELLAADIWAASARTLTDISMEEIMDLPELLTSYPAVLLQSSASADTFGSWVEMVADVGTGRRLIGVLVTYAGANTAVLEVEIGEGAAASEAAITRLAHPGRYASGVGFLAPMYVPLYRALTDNARLSARVQDNVASALDTWIAALYV